MARELVRPKTFGEQRFYRFARFLMRPGFRVLFGMRYRGAEHVPQTGPVLLAANHQSYLDPIVAGLFLSRVCHFMARDTLFDNAVLRWIICELNAFPVRRNQADITSIKECLRRLKDGHAVVLFPEGRRTDDGRIAPLQPGVIALARRSKAPIVPCAIEGAYEIWPRTRKLPRPARVWVEYGPPLTAADFEGRSDDELAAELTRRLRDLHNHVRQRAGRRPFDYTAAEPADPRPAPAAITGQGEHHG